MSTDRSTDLAAEAIEAKADWRRAVAIYLQLQDAADAAKAAADAAYHRAAAADAASWRAKAAQDRAARRHAGTED